MRIRFFNFFLNIFIVFDSETARDIAYERLIRVRYASVTRRPREICNDYDCPERPLRLFIRRCYYRYIYVHDRRVR